MCHLQIERANHIPCSCFYLVGPSKHLAKHGCSIYAFTQWINGYCRIPENNELIDSGNNLFLYSRSSVHMYSSIYFVFVFWYMEVELWGNVWWRLWSRARRKKKKDNVAQDIFFFANFCWQLTLCTCKLQCEKLSLKRKTSWKFKVSKLLSLKGAISYLMLEITAHDFQPFPEIRCEVGHYWLDMIFSNMSDTFRGFRGWVLPSLSFCQNLYMPPFHVSDVSKSLYSDCSPLSFDSVGYLPPSGFRLLNGYLEANISTF